MIAVLTNYYVEPHETIVHSNVIEVKKHQTNREFKCICCGKQWIENINSPVVIEDKEIENNLSSYYPKTIQCEKLK